MSMPQHYKCRVCDKEFYARGEFPKDIDNCKRSKTECPYKHKWTKKEKALELYLSRLNTAKTLIEITKKE